MGRIHELISRFAVLIHWHRRDLYLEMREDGLFWARARRKRGRSVIVATGRFVRAEGQSPEDLLREVARSGATNHQSIEVAFSSPDLVHSVSQIPALSAKDAALVAERRASSVCDSLDAASCYAHVQARRDGPGALWLAAAPQVQAQHALEWWSEGGIDIHRLSSRQLALANLVRMLPVDPAGGLCAIVELEPEMATCVLANADGWVFGRNVPLRLLGVRTIKLERPDPEDEEQSIELANEPMHANELDPFEQLAERAELLTMELKRTFHYVEGELGAAPVSRVYLSGDSTHTDALKDPLSSGLELPVGLMSDALSQNLRAPIDPACATVIGLALSPDRRGGNLLPLQIQRERAERVARSRLVAGLAASVFMVALVGITLGARSIGLAAQIEALDGRLAADEAPRAELEQLRQSRRRAALLAEFGHVIDRPAPKWTALLAALGRVLPDPVAVQRLHVFRQGEDWNARITADAFGTGVAEAASAISEFSKTLDESPLAKVDDVVREDAPRQPIDITRPGVRFRIDVRLATAERSTTPGVGERDGG